jgi:hypothetical protein
MTMHQTPWQQAHHPHDYAERERWKEEARNGSVAACIEYVIDRYGDVSGVAAATQAGGQVARALTEAIMHWARQSAERSLREYLRHWSWAQTDQTPGAEILARYFPLEGRPPRIGRGGSYLG